MVRKIYDFGLFVVCVVFFLGGRQVSSAAVCAKISTLVH